MVSGYELHHGDCLDELKGYADSTFDLVIADPPYYKVKNEPWDRQWETPAAFLAWLDSVVEELARVMKPNASLYLFASPKMAARVEVMISERLNVLNAITWHKENGWHERTNKEALRSYLSPWERIIFAEHYGETGATPLAAAMTAARERAGLLGTQIDVALGNVRTKDVERGTELFRRWEEGSSTPSAGDYCRALRACGDPRALAELLQEYDDLLRPFSVSAAAPWSDVWNYPAVRPYPDKHECEKPVAMLRHMIEASSRPGALILDPFAGGGSTGEAAITTGRDVVLIEKAAHNARKARRRLSRAAATLRGEFRPRVDEGAALDDLPLFMEANQ